MSCYIGSLTFPEPLVWIDKGNRVTLGSDTVTRLGHVVTVRSQAVQINRRMKLLFEMLPYDDVETLINMWSSGLTYTCKPEDTVATTYEVRFAADDGVIVPVSHQAWGDDVVKDHIEGEDTDLWAGEINLIMV